jgi:hypothetical protein
MIEDLDDSMPTLHRGISEPEDVKPEKDDRPSLKRGTGD